VKVKLRGHASVGFSSDGRKMSIRHVIAIAFACTASPAHAASYVVCDNGLRCIVAPCPSTNALDVKSRKLRKGIWVDAASMSSSDRAEIERYNGLYEGTLVVSGRFVQRTVKSIGGPKSLPFLVGEKIERKSTRREQRLCRG
jgi:hypothetical protein